VTRRDLQLLAQIRLQEAQALLKAGLPSGAYYLAGYSVECALKACIAKRTQRYDFPDKASVIASYDHDYQKLIKVAKLESEFSDQTKRDPNFKIYWELVQQWSEQSRYRTHDPQAAQALVDAIVNEKHGVMKWLKRRW
jgi:hypothetical protein